MVTAGDRPLLSFVPVELVGGTLYRDKNSSAFTRLYTHLSLLSLLSRCFFRYVEKGQERIVV